MNVNVSGVERACTVLAKGAPELFVAAEPGHIETRTPRREVQQQVPNECFGFVNVGKTSIIQCGLDTALQGRVAMTPPIPSKEI